MIQQTVIDNIDFSPNSVWVPEWSTTFFSAFRGGWTSLYGAFPYNIHYGRAVRNSTVIMTLRDPYERFASQWHWMWHTHNSTDPVFHRGRHSLQKLQQRDPVQAARVYLNDVHPVMEQYCGELHMVSQNRALESLVWRTPVKTIRYISLDHFACVLQQEFGINHYVVRNSIPNTYRQQFAPIEQLIRKKFQEDQCKWQQAKFNINTL